MAAFGPAMGIFLRLCLKGMAKPPKLAAGRKAGRHAGIEAVLLAHSGA